jgi:hypothetical protein
MAGECVIGALLVTGLTWIMARFGATLQFLVPWNRVADTGSGRAQPSAPLNRTVAWPLDRLYLTSLENGTKLIYYVPL